MILDTVKMEKCATINTMKTSVRKPFVKTETAQIDTLENADTFWNVVTINLDPTPNFKTLKIME